MKKWSRAAKVSTAAAVVLMPAATIAAPAALAANVYGVDTAVPANYYFDNLTPNQRGLLKTVVNTAGQNIGLIIDDAYPNASALTTDMTGLLAPSFSDANFAALDADLANRYQQFVDSSSTYLGMNPTNSKQVLADFINDVVLDLMTASTQVNGSNVTPFITALNNAINNGPAEVQAAFELSGQDAATFTQNIQTAVNNYLNPTPPPGGGGGTPPPTPPVEEDGGEVTAPPSAIEDNPQAVIDVIEEADEVEELVVELPTGTTNVAVPATIFNALEDKNEDAVVVVATDVATYSLPVSAVDLSALAAELGVTTPELFVFIEVKPAATQPATVNGMPVVGTAVEFTVTVSTSKTPTAANSVEVTNFPMVVERSITSPTPVYNPLASAAGVLNADGSFTVKPLLVSDITTSNGLGSEANIYSTSNSTYVVLSNFKTFVDVDGGASWAEDFVERLASRMIVNGVNATEFKPSNFITRGEFAALLSRGLGIEAVTSTDGQFSDVTIQQAANRNGEIYAAVDAGIIQGYQDGTFRPYEQITRDQAAIMISRAISYIGDDKVTFVSSKNSSDFADYDQIGAAARPHVERVYEAGYVDGFLDNTFRPDANTNRAQMSKVLYNFLQSIKFIN